MTKEKTLLLVGATLRPLRDTLQPMLPDVKIVWVEDAMQGFRRYSKLHPVAVLAEAGLEPINGFSFLSVLRGFTAADLCPIYIVAPDKAKKLPVKIDRIFSASFSPQAFVDQLKYDAACCQIMPTSLTGYERTVCEQTAQLPNVICRPDIEVSHIYSPYGDFSGDFLDYWMDGQRLYGFLIDCTGHDINSFSQVREMKIIYHLKFRQYAENLGTVMKEINQAIFDEYGVRRPLSAGLVFSLNREQEKLTYCSAGIPEFCVFRDNRYETVPMENYLIGFSREAVFTASEMSLCGISDIIFATDGLMDLMDKSVNELESAKHDDTTAIFIKIIKMKRERSLPS